MVFYFFLFLPAISFDQKQYKIVYNAHRIEIISVGSDMEI